MNEELNEEENLELLIEAIRKHQLLYDSKHEQYSDLQKKEDLWSQLSLQYNINAKRRFRSLRDRYVREKKKIDQQLSTSQTVDYPNWRFFSYLTFLDKYIRKNNNRKPNLSDNSTNFDLVQYKQNDIKQQPEEQESLHSIENKIEYECFDNDTNGLDDINSTDCMEKNYVEIKPNLEEINIENKCGQIYLKSGKFIFLCDFCENIFTNMNIYMDHILNFHNSHETNTNYLTEHLKLETDQQQKYISYENNEIENLSKENTVNYFDINSGIDDPLDVQTLKYEIEFLDETNSNINNNCNNDSIISSLDSENNDDNWSDIKNIKRSICNYEKPPKIMNENNEFPCTKCDKTYKIYKSLRDHFRIVHISKKNNNNNTISSLDSEQNPKNTRLIYEKPPKIVNENNEFPCTKCDKTYTIYKSLRDHFRIVHTSKCEYCFKKFGNLQSLKIHLQEKHSDTKLNNIEAIIFDETLVDAELMNLNVQNQLHTNSLIEFNEIISRTNQKSMPLEPKKVKNTDGKYICTLCDDVTYVRFENVKKHYRLIHLDVAKLRYFCDQCDKSFHSKFQLRVHKNIHKGIRPYKCHICSADFTHPQYLNFHIRIHLNDKRYQCTYCDKKFIRPYERIYHERSNHTNEKLYQCDDCGQTFIKYSQMNNHKNRKHNPNYVRPLYECDICKKKFTSKESMLKHKLIHEGKKPFSCDICGSKFRSRYDVNVHKKIHSDIKNYVCKICDKRFAQGPGLYSHMKSHGIALSSKKDYN